MVLRGRPQAVNSGMVFAYSFSIALCNTYANFTLFEYLCLNSELLFIVKKWLNSNCMALC